MVSERNIEEPLASDETLHAVPSMNGSRDAWDLQDAFSHVAAFGPLQLLPLALALAPTVSSPLAAHWFLTALSNYAMAIERAEPLPTPPPNELPPARASTCAVAFIAPPEPNLYPLYSEACYHGFTRS